VQRTAHGIQRLVRRDDHGSRRHSGLALFIGLRLLGEMIVFLTQTVQLGAELGEILNQRMVIDMHGVLPSGVDVSTLSGSPGITIDSDQVDAL